MDTSKTGKERRKEGFFGSWQQVWLSSCSLHGYGARNGRRSPGPEVGTLAFDVGTENLTSRRHKHSFMIL